MESPTTLEGRIAELERVIRGYQNKLEKAENEENDEKIIFYGGLLRVSLQLLLHLQQREERLLLAQQQQPNQGNFKWVFPPIPSSNSQGTENPHILGILMII